MKKNKKTAIANPKTKKDKLVNFLIKGKPVTEALAVSQFKLKNLRATVSTLREQGYNIETDRTSDGRLKYAMA